MAKATFAIELDDEEKEIFTSLTKPECTELVSPVKDRLHSLSAQVSSVISGRSVNLGELGSAEEAATKLLDLLGELPETDERDKRILQVEQQVETLQEIRELKQSKES